MLPEAQFQSEFYCTIHQLLSRYGAVSSKWTGKRTGRIDFRVVGAKWGIELVGDGDRLTEH